MRDNIKAAVLWITRLFRPTQCPECNGYVILEATVDGKTARFKVPAYEDSSGGTHYEWSKITRVEKIKKTVKVWE